MSVSGFEIVLIFVKTPVQHSALNIASNTPWPLSGMKISNDPRCFRALNAFFDGVHPGERKDGGVETFWYVGNVGMRSCTDETNRSASEAAGRSEEDRSF